LTKTRKWSSTSGVPVASTSDQVMFTPRAEYAFRHPLIRAVAYESQLKSGRAELHRRLAVAIEQEDRGRPTRTPP
jgi:adenylate cyclase